MPPGRGKGKLVGIVTTTDLLELIGQKFQPPVRKNPRRNL
jgi:hypothetical protein